MRWNHPERGMVSPADFIPLAEETGLILPLGEWVLRTACTQAARWPQPVGVAVNLSAMQFKGRNLVQLTLNALAASGLPAGRLDLEITESVLLQDETHTLALLHQLREIGVRISMDDFGTGYSSLAYLRNFPFDKIKIDRSFVRDMLVRKDCQAIIRAVVGPRAQPRHHHHHRRHRDQGAARRRQGRRLRRGAGLSVRQADAGARGRRVPRQMRAGRRRGLSAPLLRLLGPDC